MVDSSGFLDDFVCSTEELLHRSLPEHEEGDGDLVPDPDGREVMRHVQFVHVYIIHTVERNV